jgi:hypothetical protein
MTESHAEEKTNIFENDPLTRISLESKIQLLFLGLLSISFLFNYALRDELIGLIFAHTAALSIMGFYGCLAGAVAKKKGFSYGRAFLIGFFLPIISGVVSAFLIGPAEQINLPFTCGGWTSLAAGIVVVFVYVFAKKKDKSGHRD